MHRFRLALACLVILLAAAVPAGAAAALKVKLGIDTLREQNFEPLKGKRVGLVVNPASVDSRLVSTVEVLRNAPGVKLVALFGPEHGVYGDEYAGDKVDDRVEPNSGIPIYSLYGATRKVSPERMAEIDVLVFDLQDIGSRSYTYISSMELCLEACAEANKELMILDRPNPLGGVRVEGAMVEDAKFESFVSALPVPYLHGMTMAELAQMTRDRQFPKFDKLTMMKMGGWERKMVWEDTGLAWIPTSPHVPHATSTWAYAATGIAGELYQISNGVGYTLPFEVVGSPKTDGVKLATTLQAHWPKADGLVFRPVRYKPFYATFKTELCQGVQVHADPRSAESLVEVNYRILEAMDAPAVLKAAEKRHAMFDKVSGTDEIRIALEQGKDLEPIFAKWRAGCEAFRKERAGWLLYQ